MQLIGPVFFGMHGFFIGCSGGGITSSGSESGSALLFGFDGTSRSKTLNKVINL